MLTPSRDGEDRLGLLRSCACLLALILAGVLSYADNVTPRPVAANASPLGFSAERAMKDIRILGAAPHPVGSPANALVRDYLVTRLNSLGLSPQIQRGSSFFVYDNTIYGAAVENVIGVLPGRDRAAPALVLMAHRDSVAGSPGAADDAAGVASALEIVRTLKAKGAPARDIIVLLTDGEEAGLLGSRVFFEKSPLAAHVGYVINLEAGGDGGRAAMFETAPANGGDIALYRRTARQPDSNALTVLLYRHMPNDTDFTAAEQHGKVGLNYAFIGRHFGYHSPSSTPDDLEVGALQHLGAQVLPTAEALAFGPLPARAPDVVYATLPFGLLPIYPPWAGWIILAAAAGLLAAGAAGAGRMDALRGSDFVRGAGVSLYVVATSGVLLELARRATGVGSGWMPYRALLARFSIAEAMMVLAALGAVFAAAVFAGRPRARWIAAGLPLLAGVSCFIVGGGDIIGLVLGVLGGGLGLATFGRPAKIAGAWTGMLATGLLVAAVLQILEPHAAYIATWPVLAASLAASLTGAGADQRTRALLCNLLIAIGMLAWLGDLFDLLIHGLDQPLLLVAPTWLAAIVLWPLAGLGGANRLGAVLAGVCIGASLALAGYLHTTSPWTARHPRAVEPVYIVDASKQQAWRASLLEPDDWTRRVLGAEGGRPTQLPLDFQAQPVQAAVAALVAQPPAPALLTAEPDGHVRLKVGLNPGAASITVSLRSLTPIDHVLVDGRPALATPKDAPARPYALAPRQLGELIWSAPTGFTLDFHTANPAGLEVHTAEFHDRWMGMKPPSRMPAFDQAWDRAGSTIVTATVRPSNPGAQ